MSYLGKDIRKPGPERFMYRQSNIEEHYFDAPCQPDDVVPGASDDFVNANVSAGDSEADSEVPKLAPGRPI